MVRIEIHLDKTETDILDAIAKEDGRSRKNGNFAKPVLSADAV